MQTVAHVGDILIPTSTALQALVSLSTSRAGKAFGDDGRGHQTQAVCQGGWGRAIDHEAREPDGQIFWHFIFCTEFCDVTVFFGGQPEFNLWQILCNLSNLL